MPSPAMNFGVQSYCFRRFENHAQLAELTRRIGVGQIELCRLHVDFNDEASFDPIIQIYRDAGVAIVSIGVEDFTEDEDSARKRFEFVRKCGARFISANFSPESYKTAMPIVHELAEAYDVRLGIHNHGGYHWLGNSQMLDYVFTHIAGPRIGLTLDTAWCLAATEDPLKWADRFAGRIFGVHYKDFIFDRSAKEEDVVVGTGNLELPAFVQKLEAGGFDGFAVLEYEGDADNPVPPLTECVQKMQALNPGV